MCAALPDTLSIMELNRNRYCILGPRNRVVVYADIYYAISCQLPIITSLSLEVTIWTGVIASGSTGILAKGG